MLTVRDLKPENLLIDYDNTIKIIDFGLSNVYNENEMLKTACGSPCYAAPEMLTGKPYSALTVDIWSCGIVLYAILCGTLPFEDSNTAQLYAKIRNGSYSTPNYLSENAKSLLKGILNTDPYDRFTLEQIQAHPWYNTAFIQSPEAVLGINLIRDKINCMIVEEITKYGIQKDDIIESIINSKHNYFTTLYSLLQKKKDKGNRTKPKQKT